MSIVTYAAVRARFPGAYIVGGDLIARTDAGLIEFGRETDGGFDLTAVGQAAFDAAKPARAGRAAPQPVGDEAAAPSAGGADGALNAELGAGA